MKYSDLGISTHGMNKRQVAEMQRSVASAIDLHEKTTAAEIQRRGQNLPGDIGNNFGLMANSLHGGPQGPFADTWPGSYFFSGMFGGFGEGSVGGFGGLGLQNFIGQGSYAAFTRNTRAAHHKMAACVTAYKGFGLAKNVIDLMANFASEGIKIRHPNKSIQKFLNRWAFHVDIPGRVKDILRYYYKYGNVFVYRTMGVIDQKTYDRLRRSKARLEIERLIKGFRPILADNDPITDVRKTEREDLAEEESTKPIGEKEIPWRYTLLNPFQMELRGTKYFGGQRWVFVLDHTTVNDLQTQRLKNQHAFWDFLDESKVNLPPEFLDASKKISDDARPDEMNDSHIVELDQNNLYTMHYMKDDHDDWAEPLLWPVMADIYYKNKLRQMDMSVCNSVINSVVIYKLGDFKNGFIPPKEHLEKFAEFLRTPTQAMNMVWNDAIDVVDSYPPVDKILGVAKYESVDRDILKGIGIPDTLIGGGSKSNFSTGFLGVRTLLERLEEGRNTVMRWLLKELELLVTSMGIRKLPTIQFGKMSLRDEQAEKQLIIQLLDRNIISIEAVLEAFGEDFEIELERLKEENTIREDTGLLQKHSPYVDPINTLDPAEQMQKESELRQQEQRLMQKFKQAQDKEKRNAQGPNGRPVNTKGVPHDKKRETKPKGMAWFVEYERAKAGVLSDIHKVEEIVVGEILKANKKVNKRQLSKLENKAAEDITFAISSQLGGKVVSLDIVQEILRTNPSIQRRYLDIYKAMCSENPSMEDRKVAMASSIVMVQLGDDDADR